MVGEETPSLDRVIRLIDTTILVMVPIVAIGGLIKPPAGSSGWVLVFGGMLGVLAVIAVLGRLGRIAWRGAVYPFILLAGGAVGLWANGPFAGTGVAFALATMLAAAFLSRRALIAFVVIGAATIAIRIMVAAGVDAAESQIVEFSEFRPWLRIAVVSGLLLLFGTLILQELMATLERAYSRTAAAYRIETEAVAELARARRELDEVQQIELVGRLAGGVAHDINNALSSIFASSDVLGDKVSTVQQRQWLGELEAASQQAADLVRDLLWIGRKLPSTTETAELGETVRACRTRLERMSRHLAIEVQLAPSLHIAIAPERLEQVLFWLIIRAHRSGITELSLTAHREGPDVVIELRGLERGGVPSTSGVMQPKAVRASLGTSATHELIEQAGGKLALSEEGGLLCVELRLPAASSPRPKLSSTTHAVRIALVVEDEPLVLERLAKLVAGRGYRVLTAASLAEAWPLLAQEPDLLVTDLQLGDGRGDELAIASFERHPERPIVICSGFGADDSLLEKLRDAQVTFLSKPFTRLELEAAIPKTILEVA